MSSGRYLYTAVFSDGTVVHRRSDRDYKIAYRFTLNGQEWARPWEGAHWSLPSGFSANPLLKPSHNLHPSKWLTREQNSVIAELEKQIKLEIVPVTQAE